MKSLSVDGIIIYILCQRDETDGGMTEELNRYKEGKVEEYGRKNNGKNCGISEIKRIRISGV